MFANTVTIFIVIQLAPMLMWPARASIQAALLLFWVIIIKETLDSRPGLPPSGGHSFSEMTEGKHRSMGNTSPQLRNDNTKCSVHEHGHLFSRSCS
jgi:hypothetical protein